MRSQSAIAIVICIASSVGKSAAFSPQRSVNLNARWVSPHQEGVHRFAKKPWWKVWSSPNDGTDESNTDNPDTKKDGDGDITSSPVFLKKKIQVLEKDIVQAEEKAKMFEAAIEADNEEWGPQISRLNKEYSFMRQRNFNESKLLQNNVRASVVTEILPVMDNFYRAEGALSASTDGEQNIMDHYKQLFGEMTSVLDEWGLEVIPALGEPFDFNLHEGIMQEPSDEYAEDVCSTEYQKGYTLEGKLVRASIVAVSLGPGP